MRARYSTRAIVIARTPLAEASALLYMLTPDFGLVKARAQGLRRPGAKLASATTTLAECDAILVRGKEAWRLSGALLARERFGELTPSERRRAGRIARLILRLVHGETHDPALFAAYEGFLDALPGLSEEEAEVAECLAALHILGSLGLDAGELPGGEALYGEEALREALHNKKELMLRANRGIIASGL